MKRMTKCELKNNSVVVLHSSGAFIGLDQSSLPQCLHVEGKPGGTGGRWGDGHGAAGCVCVCMRMCETGELPS